MDLTINLSNVRVIPPSVGVHREFLTPIENELGNYLLIIDNTALEKVIRCPTAGMYYILYGREGHARNAALTFGGAIHDGLEAFYKGEDAIDQDAAVVRFFVENPTPPDEYRTPPIALQVMQHYREACAIREDFKDAGLEDEQGPIIERPFEIPLGVLEIGDKIRLPKWNESRLVNQIHVAWAGRIDRIVGVPGRTHNFVKDHKTTSIGGDQFIQSFQLSNQTIGYVWAAQQMWPEHNILGFCLNAIHLKKPTGNGLLTSKGPRGGEPALNFFRAYFDYTQERIDQWQKNTLTIIEDFVHNLVRDFFPLYTNHCFNKFGRCPYFDVDTIDNPEVRIRMLMSDAFKDVTWDPTQGR
jgi:hypothetical protein